MNHTIYIYLLLFFFCISCKNEVPPTDSFSDGEQIELPPLEEDYEESKFKWGYIDHRGRLVIEAKYDDSRSFSEGMAVVRKKGYWGYINKRGKEVIKPQYKGAYDFSEDLARIQSFEDGM